MSETTWLEDVTPDGSIALMEEYVIEPRQAGPVIFVDPEIFLGEVYDVE